MRHGKNPAKFSRHHSNIANIKPKIAENFSVITVSFVPRLTDYYAEGLDVLKLTLTAIRTTIPVPFDLIVIDNGSCAEVKDFLKGLLEDGKIQVLVLLNENMKKIGALNYALTMAQGEYIYYFDSDILHKKGWYEAVMKIARAYPKAGLINAAPFASADKSVMTATMKAIEEDPKISSHLLAPFSLSQIDSYAEAMGTDAKKYRERANKYLSYFIERNGVKALPIANHSHFLINKKVVEKLFPVSRDWHIQNREKDLDVKISEAGFMRLGTMDAHIVHLGNVLSKKWRDYGDTLAADLGKEKLRHLRKRNLFRKILTSKYMKGVILKLHGITFRLLYNVE
jgi:glycosyltransferase involved in cell wall biosynthesis